MVDFVTEGGGFLTLEDLAEFRAEVAPASHRSFPGLGHLTVHTTPPQWSQGPALLQALAILQQFDLDSFGHNSTAYLHHLVEAVKLAFSDRERYYGDAGSVNLSSLLSDEHAAELAAFIRPDRSLPDLFTLRHEADQQNSTTQVTVVDSLGNAFASAPSDPLAMSPIVPGLGVLVSGRGVQSRTDPDHPACLGPGRRPRVTPSPVIVIDDDGMVWPITCPGGDMIVQATLQSLLNVAVFGMTEQQAVEAPRAISMAFPNSFHPHGHHEGMVAVENRVPEVILEDLSSLGHDVREWPPFEFEAGSVGMIRQTPYVRGRKTKHATRRRRSPARGVCPRAVAPELRLCRIQGITARISYELDRWPNRTRPSGTSRLNPRTVSRIQGADKGPSAVPSMP